MRDILKKTLYHFSKGQLRGILYGKIFLQMVPKIVGYISLLLYRGLYKHIRVGKNIKCWGRVIITKSPESIVAIGDNARLVSDFARASIGLYSRCKFQLFFNSKIIIGQNVGLNGTSITCRTTFVKIGDGTIMAPNVIIVDSDFHQLWPPENRTFNMGYENDKGVKIGKNVWIGMNSTILKGVTIGDNSIIAAGSVVAENIPSNVLVGGVPAKILKQLK
ncbi:acyltransferase [Candidatus Peregrinibacteria bacterium]|nr:acyltransferase [Candidatus Peregrinibacteria bacterium]